MEEITNIYKMGHYCVCQESPFTAVPTAHAVGGWHADLFLLSTSDLAHLENLRAAFSCPGDNEVTQSLESCSNLKQNILSPTPDNTLPYLLQ